jgi:hypothetical protein
MSALKMSPADRALFKEANRRAFEDLERDYSAGKKQALIEAIALGAFMDVALPTWAREAIIEACFESRPQSWDDVFGRPLAKGKSAKAARRRRSKEMAVIGRVKELNSQRKPKLPIGAALFRKVGKEFGVSGGIVSKIYYDKQAAGRFEIRKLEAEVKALGPDADEDTVADWLRQNIHRLPKLNKAKF